jgi:hypothetical protein
MNFSHNFLIFDLFSVTYYGPTPSEVRPQAQATSETKREQASDPKRTKRTDPKRSAAKAPPGVPFIFHNMASHFFVFF